MRPHHSSVSPTGLYAHDEESEDEQGTLSHRSWTSRKQERKKERHLKKARKLAWYTKKTVAEVLPQRRFEQDVGAVSRTRNPPNSDDRSSESNARRKRLGEEQEKLDQRRVEEIKQKRREEQLQRLEVENEEDNRLIKKLAKRLHLTKRKDKTKLPASFSVDGLNYLLEVLDNPDHEMKSDDEQGGAAKDQYSVFQDPQDSGDEEDDEAPLEIIRKSSRVPVGTHRKMPPENAADSMELDSMEEESDASEEESGEEADEDVKFLRNEASSLEEDDEMDTQATSDSLRDGPWEDIYGRLRAADGSILPTISTGKYVPPALKALSGESQSQQRLERQLKGLLNRLAEANMASIVSQVAQLFMTNSRHDMNGTLTRLILNSCVQSSLMPKRLAMEHGMFIGLLYQHVGTEAGAFFVQELLRVYDEIMSGELPKDDDKRLDNVVLLWCHLLNFKVIHSVMVFGVLQEFIERFKEKDIDMILIIFREVGFLLRRDNPGALKNVLATVQTKASEVRASKSSTGSRLDFMLDVIAAIKNNNMRKIPNYDPSELEHLIKVFRGLLRKGHAMESELNISLADLRVAKDRGKWWVVGAAWNRPELPPQTRTDKSSVHVTAQVPTDQSGQLFDLAAKQRMNTDIRKSIFCAVMGADDFDDAFKRVQKLGLKSAQESEVVHVLLHCGLHEKQFNPYYAFVMENFCIFHRAYQRQFLYAFWDKIRDLPSLTTTQQQNLAEMVAHGLIHNALPIIVLKKTNFADMNPPLVKFLRIVLSHLLLTPSESSVSDMFSKIPDAKYKIFRESMRLFVRHFMIRNARKVLVGIFGQFTETVLERRIDIAERALLGTNKL